jgi:hypothetical protein
MVRVYGACALWGVIEVTPGKAVIAGMPAKRVSSLPGGRMAGDSSGLVNLIRGESVGVSG